VDGADSTHVSVGDQEQFELLKYEALTVLPTLLCNNASLDRPCLHARKMCGSTCEACEER
jgi:hypothetical protein